MRTRHYTFVTTWNIRAPLESVWDALVAIEDWPRWWKGVKHSKIIEHRGITGGVGSRVETAWKSWLPYTLHFVLTVTEANPSKLRLVATAEGDLHGTGTWVFQRNGTMTTATYTWEVTTSKPWMNALGGVLRPIFSHAHHVVMRRGLRGLQQLLKEV